MNNTTNFYHFRQNNSGGIIESNTVICTNVIIEADSISEANGIAEKLGCYWDGVKKGLDCDCCGDRWHRVQWSLNDDLKDYEMNTVEDLIEYLSTDIFYDSDKSNELWGRIFYKNKEVKEIYKKTTTNDN